MGSTRKTLARGLRLHTQGRLADAAALYQQVTHDEPGNADAVHLLGVLAHVAGEHERAAALIGQAITLNPDEAGFHNNLGEALRALRRFDEAAAAFTTALRLDPAFAEARNNLGNVRFEQARFAEAAAEYEAALRQKPSLTPWWINLGNALLRCDERGAEAVAAYERALQLEPDNVEAHNMLGMAHRAVGGGRYDAAELCLRRALSLRGDYVLALNNLGIVLKEQGRFSEAEQVLGQAIALRPDFSEAHDTLGATRLARGDTAGAIAAFEAALHARPTFHQARWNRALALLSAGEYGRGFAEYEARFDREPALARHFDKPRWTGAALDGKRILIHAEQGLGDTIQFARFLSAVAQRGGRVILECQAALVELMRGVEGVAEVLGAGDPLPTFDVHAPLLSLPHLLGVTVETLPAQIPYLHPSLPRIATCRDTLARWPGLRVGVNWQGNPRFHDDRFRSIPLRALLPLADVPGVTLLSLQRGPGLGQLQRAMPIVDPGFDDSLSTTAAAIAALDLVITSDTMIAHLAGALGKPVWVLLSFAADWRYQLDPVANPWYPTMRLFRQERFHDWLGVVAHAATALRQGTATRAAA